MTKINMNKESEKKDLTITINEPKVSAMGKVRRFVVSFTEFIEETKSELRKVNWLDRNKLFTYFAIVMIITITFTLLVTFMDIAIAETFRILNIII